MRARTPQPPIRDQIDRQMHLANHGTHRNSPTRVSIILALAAALLVGCGDSTSPTGPQGVGENPGDVLQLEGSLAWTTTSVSWLNESALGVVPVDQYAIITIATQAGLNGPSHFLFESSVNARCADMHCHPGSSSWADPGILISHLDWSPVGARVVLESRARQGQQTDPPRIAVMSSDGSSIKYWENGLAPSFSRNGAQIVFSTLGKDVLRLINADSGEGGDLFVDLHSAENPRFSPNDSLMAFSAQDGERGRRIFVGDVHRPEFYPDLVSDPDDTQYPSRDGMNDNDPTWSPSGEYLAYIATITRTGSYRDGIFVTTPGSEPEMIEKVHTFPPGQRVTYIRWHPNGRLMLYVMQGNVFMLVMPEQYWD